MSLKENMSFEQNVRRIADAVWNLPPGTCQPRAYPNETEVHEIDGVVELLDTTHLVMVTVSTRLDKIRDDVKKLNKADSIEKKKGAYSVIKWVITREQLNATHIEYASQNNVRILTLEQFRRRFFDGKRYIDLRKNCTFGSARNPNNFNVDLPDDAYISLPIKVIYDSSAAENNKQRHYNITIKQIAGKIKNGTHVVLVASFGSGKSLTTREIFKELVALHEADSGSPIPLTINLREHWGQISGDEVLRRHGNRIGYTPRESDLVVAWRSGMCSLLLDGFDEVYMPGVAKIEEKNYMQQLRIASLTGVRDFYAHLPGNTGIFICGRDNYFDTPGELTNALALAGKSYIVAKLGEFSEERAQEFLSKNGIDIEMPQWLPRKPLILTYLINKNLFNEVFKVDGDKGFGYVWDRFIDLICLRESELSNNVIPKEAMRSILEILSENVRGKFSGTGPINSIDLADAYMIETGQSVDDVFISQLQRLPGLTERDQDPGNRSFVDADMLAALQGSALTKRIIDNFKKPLKYTPLSELTDNSISFAAYLLTNYGFSLQSIINIMYRFYQTGLREHIQEQLLADCFQVSLRIAIDSMEDEVDFLGIVIRSSYISTIPFDEIKIKNISFDDCIIKELSFGSSYTDLSVGINRCTVTKITGFSRREALPENMFDDKTEVIEFDSLSTNSSILQLNVSDYTKALLIILRKVYKLPGSGRKTNALQRGIGDKNVSSKIPAITKLLEKREFISTYDEVIHPIRNLTSRVDSILSSPHMCDDPIAQEIRELN